MAAVGPVGAGRGLVILDFSGTLSIAAARFAERETITATLRECGLEQLGIDHDLLWAELINPTWQEGSTTTRGYVDVLTAAAIVLLRSRDDQVPAELIEHRVAAFARRYLAANRIAPQWTDWLHRFATLRGTTVVVATDHYADATALITAELSSLGIDSAPIVGARGVRGSALFIANSADLGYHKSSPHFWRAVRDALPGNHFAHVVLIDDFGANEHAADTYAAGACLRTRATVEALKAVFALRPEVFGFVLDCPAANGDETDDAFGHLVEAAGRFTLTALTS